MLDRGRQGGVLSAIINDRKSNGFGDAYMNITLTSSSNEKKIYQDSTYELVSKIAYLLGVPKRIFENEHEPAPNQCL